MCNRKQSIGYIVYGSGHFLHHQNLPQKDFGPVSDPSWETGGMGPGIELWSSRVVSYYTTIQSFSWHKIIITTLILLKKVKC